MTTCPACTRWHEIPERLQVICDRCGMPILIVSEREPFVGDDRRVWIGVEHTQAWRRVRSDGFVADNGGSWAGAERTEEFRGVALDELPVERQRPVLLRLVYDRVVRILEDEAIRRRPQKKDPFASWYGWRDEHNRRELQSSLSPEPDVGGSLGRS